jgi:hypothetical protein
MDISTLSRILERQTLKTTTSLAGYGGTKDTLVDLVPFTEIGIHSMTLLFAELIKHAQLQAKGIDDMEDWLSNVGQEIGIRIHILLANRDRNLRKEIRILNILYYIHQQFYKAAFGKAADSVEKSNDSPDSFMIIDNCPVLSQFISVPKDLSNFNPNVFVAGMIQSVLSHIGFPASVSAHSQPTSEYPLRTVFLLRFSSESIQREPYS